MALIFVKPHGASGQGEGFSPSSFTWGRQDISASDSGRTHDAVMHKDLVDRKVKLSLGWNGPDRKLTARILKAFEPVYVDITYPNPESETENTTKTFYTGDISAPFHIWTVNNKMYKEIRFDVIER